MDMLTRMDAVRASVRLPRVAFISSLVLSIATLALLAGALLASSANGLFLMNIDRFDDADATVAVTITDETDQIEVSAETDAAVTYEIIAEEDVRWLSDEVRYFNGRPIRPVKKLTMVVTAYSPDERSCGKWADGITASGYSVWTNGMKLVAADTSILPFGSLVSIPGYHNENPVPVLDRGGAIKGKRLDVLYATHERALRWGVQELEVIVWDYADGAPNGFRTNHPRRR